MDFAVVDVLFETFGPFLFPAALFAAGAVGYAVLLLAGRLLADEEPTGWPTGTAETGETDEAVTDTDRHEG